MQVPRIKLYETINPGAALEAIHPYFPWAEKWVIRVSPGLTHVVLQLLTDIEEILGKKPAIDFLRIIDDVSDGQIYQRKLLVFIDIKDCRASLSAKKEAISHVVKRAINDALGTCYACGCKLTLKNIADQAEREKYPFLPDPDSVEFSDKIWLSELRIMVCMSCAEWLYNKEPRLEPGEVCPEIFDSTDDVEEIDEIEIETELESNSTDNASDKDYKTVRIFDINDVDLLEKTYKDAAKDVKGRITGLVKRLRDSNPEKHLASIPADWRDGYCESLVEKFPNFAEVVEFIRNQLALSEAGDGVFRLPPFALIGPPGIGKTEFTLTLTDDLGTKLEIIDIAGVQTGSPLTGSEAYWSNSQPGTLFNTLCFSDVGNPVILLDEIDKAQGVHNPLAALHQLLEPRQAKRFNDLSVSEMTIDASHVIWVATANSIESLEKPIIDRFTVFNIEDPSPGQMSAIAINQYRRFIEKHPSGEFFEKTIREDVLVELCKNHPRKVRKLLDQAFGLAAYDKRNYLTVQDIRASDKGEKRKSGIGFLSTDF